jgi:acyl-CoA synthetase (AMP-forming)/AMP-acid ligase II
VLEHAANQPDAACLRHAQGEFAFTYGQLATMVGELCALFEATNVKPGGSVALIGEHPWLFHPLLVACAAYGSVLVPIDRARPDEELRRILLSACPRLVISESIRHLPNPNGGQTYLSTKAVADRLEVALSGANGAARRVIDRGHADAVVLMPFSLGMTGRLNGIMLTHDNLVAAAQALARVHRFTSSDVIACVPPFHHILPIILGAVLPLYSGASIVLWNVKTIEQTTINSITPLSGTSFLGIETGDDALSYWNEVNASGATTCVLKPTIMAELLGAAAPEPIAPPRSLRFALCGGGVLTKELWRTFEERFGVVVHQGYGLSEATGWATCTSTDRGRDSVGLPLDCEVRVQPIPNLNTDELSYDRRHRWRPQDSLDPRPGPLGEIQIKGRAVMAGYFKNPKGTQEQLTSDRFLRTGDIGFIDGEGLLHFVGRLKETIVRNGRTIYPRDIDRVADLHEQVLECKTIGIPDVNANQRLITCVVPRGVDPAQVRTDELLAWLKQQLPEGRAPDSVFALAALPRSANGGVSTATLRGITTGRVTESILENLTKAKYSKSAPSDIAAIKRLVDRTIVSNQLLRFVCYWGAGHRSSASGVDEDALRRLFAYLRSLEVIPALKSSLVIVLQDMHAQVNRVSRDVYEPYHREIEQLAVAQGFMTVRMSDLYREWGVRLEQAIVYASSPEFLEYWQKIPIRELLVSQATKYSRDKSLDPEVQARNYLGTCLLEGKFMPARFSDHVFLSYTMPDMDPCLPPMPKCYLYSSRKWSSSRPWFSD